MEKDMMGMDMEMMKEMMMREHWAKYMEYKMFAECNQRMGQYYNMMSQYHYQMYMHHCTGGPMPPMPGMQCPPPQSQPVMPKMPEMPETPMMPGRPMGYY